MMIEGVNSVEKPVSGNRFLNEHLFSTGNTMPLVENYRERRVKAGQAVTFCFLN
jgi:hypothetical protein